MRGILTPPLVHSIVIIFFILVITGCGHKQRSVLYTPVGNKKHISKLMFPAPRNIVASTTNEGNCISWQAPHSPKDTTLEGYNVYRITRKNCIPRKPLCTEPIIAPKFLDDKKNYKDAQCYIVRAVFKIDDTTVQGPLSQMVKIAP